MIYLTDEEKDKVQLIDEVFNALSFDDLRNMFGSDLVVAKLKSSTPHSNLRFSQVFDELHRLQGDVAMLRADTASMRADIKDLISVLSKGTGDQYASSVFNTLKSRHGIY